MTIDSFRIRMKDYNGIYIDGETILSKEKKGKYSLISRTIPGIKEFNSLEEAFAYEHKGRSIESRVAEWKEFPPMILDAPSNWFELWLETQKE